MAVTLAWLLAAPAARAEEPAPPETARTLYDKATGAYALGNYKRAAELYERAFELKADPALLFNMAQAYRLAGNKERAHDLYRSYLRVYPKGPGRVEATRHAENLKRDLDQKTAAAAIAPATTPVAPPPVAPAAPPSFAQPSPGSEADLAAKPAESNDRPLLKRPIFWVITGAVVLVAVGAGIAVAASRGSDSKSPAGPTWGTVGGPGM
jgi:tetratricopeptide (TPR) repeat protein